MRKWIFFQWVIVGCQLLVVGCWLLVASPVFAQGLQFNLARTLAISDKNAGDGDIVSLSNTAETLSLSTKSYDERMYGVLVADPVMVYRTSANIPVSRQGDAIVNVSMMGGAIGVGDYITSSEIPGKGQKAEGIAGYMLGVALSSFDGKGATQSATYQGKTYALGRVSASIGIGPASPVITKAAGGIFGTLKQIATAIMFNISSSKQAERIIRYILAVLIAVIVIYVSYRTFGANVTKGMEAIGRNPLAKSSIQAMITLNVVLLAISCIAGVVLSLVVISL
ncbi:MAG TPA: hypothetical protein VMR81_04965 [Patescibacteria group bacterium]|nr:hypothetical protein [Patescibacteria group bacterium]